MEALQDALLNLLIVVVGLVAAFIGQKGSEYLKKKGVLAQLESKKNYVAIVVSAVQQVYAEANGDAKLQEAKAQLVDLFNKNGIKFTEDELNLLIESAVKGMKASRTVRHRRSRSVARTSAPVSGMSVPALKSDLSTSDKVQSLMQMSSKFLDFCPSQRNFFLLEERFDECPF